MIPVVLSGGSGTRLWPLSRIKLPKQFCSIFEQSLHSMTLSRLAKWGTPYVVTSQTLKDLTVKNLNELGLKTDNVILEPLSKNTAPAVALLTVLLLRRGQGDSVAGIFPADHIIENEEKFTAAIHLAKEEALKGKVVILGIQPDYPATGYGYIQTGKDLLAQQGEFVSHPVLKFHEKPSLEKATQFIKSEGYYWNAGIFIFKVSAMADYFRTYQPSMWTDINKLNTDLSNIQEVYSSLDSISIDYAIMEKLLSDELACIPCDIGWNDVGSWDAISQILSGANPTNKIEVRSKHNYVQSSLKKTYAFVEVEDMIVVDTADALLISKKGASQGVKDVVDILKLRQSSLLKDHVFEERPWGRFEILKDTEIFKSKVVTVNPAQQLSYQSHSQREEHWLVTQGKGEVVLNDTTIPVNPGSYVKIPLGAKHRIRNIGEDPVEFVEVQLG
ncbi:MAG: mannose-1-phosphate guanylyltransferase/mannose-6-phosphate isomerase, partial [Bdellovibrionales bacterium]|nr:mannose-1-phosphate guanylyltransferase/mannose-6-phosphate isomerase [Bdellovibrionales bacterium]